MSTPSIAPCSTAHAPGSPGPRHTRSSVSSVRCTGPCWSASESHWWWAVARWDQVSDESSERRGRAESAADIVNGRLAKSGSSSSTRTSSWATSCCNPSSKRTDICTTTKAAAGSASGRGARA